MGVFKLSISKLRYKPWNGLMTILLFAVGSGIISLVAGTEKLVKDQFLRNLAGIDLVVGAKGSPVQLILSSLFHMDVPTGNISFDDANRLANHPMVGKSVPISLGDNYQGIRIVGTTPAFGELYGANLATGSWFTVPFDAVVGSEAAKTSGLQQGTHFTGRHGFTEHGHHHDEDLYTVTGILAPTGTIIDFLILTSLDTYWLIHSEHDHHDHTGHEEHDHTLQEDHHHHDHDHDHDHGHSHGDAVNDTAASLIEFHEESGHSHETDYDDEAEWLALIEKLDRREDLSPGEMHLYQSRAINEGSAADHPGKQITALLLKYETPRAAIQLPRFINENTRMQAASPAFETHRLFAIAGNGLKVLRWLAYIIMGISALHLLGHLTQTLSRNLHEIALLRTLGASRRKVMLLLLLQGIWISILGAVSGVIVAKFLLMMVIQQTGSLISSWGLFSVYDLWLLAFSPLVGVMAALLPAIKAYRKDIHYVLTSE